MPDAPSDVVIFRVIGERTNDPGHLLLSSPDGRLYDYDVARGTVAPAEPTDCWDVDPQDGAEVRLWAPSPLCMA